MLKKVLPIVISLIALPLFSQTRMGRVDITAGYSIASLGETEFEDGVTELELDDADGLRLGLEFFWTDAISTNVSYSQLESDAILSFGDAVPAAFNLGKVDLKPLAATLRWHFVPQSRLDVFVGAGALYATFDEVESPGLLDLEIERLELEDTIAPAVELGVRLGLTPSFGFTFDAMYAPFETESRATFVGDAGPGEPTDLEINPLIISGLVSFRF